jgi:hypothetical protein
MSFLRRSFLAVAIASIVSTLGLRADDPVKVAPATRPVDLVICLDVSGSMEGLITSAKIKLWDIVNELGKMKPSPTLRVGLYSYGGGGPNYPAGGGYIHRELDLTMDLDSVYEKLNALKITGHIEYATGVSHRAIETQKWSSDENALKIVFVCGNEAANQDPRITYEILGKAAYAKNVIVNSIYCGPANDAIAPGWKTLAATAGGQFANIDMNKAGQIQIETPFDQAISDLSTKLNTTYVLYGKDNAKYVGNQSIQDNNAAGNGAGVAAARGVTKANAQYRNDGWDLIDRMKNDPKFDIKSVKEDELCDEMKKLTVDERVAYLKKKLDERNEIQKSIIELGGKRAKFIEAKLKEEKKTDSEKALDEALKSMIRSQAKAKGFTIGD